MASTVLSNGIIIPEKYSRDWYNDLYHNWQELDNLLGGGTPKDGTLTIQKNGTTVGTFSANQATDETIDITVPDVNNATLTIQQNGTTVDTFTANSSTDKTANIQCVDLTNNQTVGGNKEFTGTTTAHDLVPSATDTYNLGGSSYQWNNAYIKSLTINGVECGDILTHNASEFVDVSSNQTIGGVKTFSSSPRVTKTSPDIALNISDCDVTETPTEAKFASLYFRDKNNKNLAYITCQQRTDGIKRMCIRAHRTDNINNYYSVNLDSDGNFYPEQSNTINLGTSTLKWKSVYTNGINGLNPGALSLPSNNVVNILSELQSNGYIAPSDGYVRAIKDVQTQCTSTFGIRNETTRIEDRRITERQFILGVIVPVQAGEKVIISDDWNSVNNANITYNAYFYPCQGSV